MENSESEPILPKPKASSSSNATKNNDITSQTSTRRRWVPIEVVAILYVITYTISVPVSTFYVYSKVSEKYGVKDFVRKGQNGCENNSTHKRDVINKIQKDAADQFMYLSLFSVFPALLSVLYIGSISDKYGRPISLIISFSGLLIKEIVYVIVIYTGAPFFVLCIGHFLQGITGYTSSAPMVIFGIIADITVPGKQRAFRMTVMEAIIAITAGITEFTSGFFIKYSGFLIPTIVSSLMCLINIVVTIIFIPETKDRRHVEFDCKFAFMRCFNFYFRDTETKRRRYLLLCQIIIVLTALSVLGKIRVETLFLLNRPLCWSELHVQIFSFVENVGKWVVSVVTVHVLLKYLMDLSIIFIGCFVGTVAFILYAFAKEDWVVYLYVSIGAFAVTVIPMVRSLISRLVSKEEQGAVFASIAFVELLCHLLTATAYIQTYKYTESYFPGLIFLVMAALMFLAVLVSTILSFWMKQSEYYRLKDKKQRLNNYI